MMHRRIDLVTSGSRSHHGGAFVLVGFADFHRHCHGVPTLQRQAGPRHNLNDRLCRWGDDMIEMHDHDVYVSV
jgi:hypothetical protein